MPFSPAIKTEALVACGRCCSICHKFCGTKIECHHIVPEAGGGPNTLENCIPLCFDCHADMLSYDDNHAKGTKYRPKELKKHRDQWFSKVSNAHPADYTDEHRLVDKGLLRRLFRLLPWKGSIRFISEHHFAGSFALEELSDLEKFELARQDPSYEFIDPTLESTAATLTEEIQTFLSVLARETFSLDAKRYGVPREWKSHGEGDRFYNAVSDISNAATRCVDAYKAFIREGRHRLAVEVESE